MLSDLDKILGPLPKHDKWSRKSSLYRILQGQCDAKLFVDLANKHYLHAGTHQRATLEHARKSGQFLLEAKARVRHSEWGGFLDKYFRGSRETARVYMRVAEYWDDPRILDARRGGMTLNSINGILEIIRGDRPKSKVSPGILKAQQIEPEPQAEQIEPEPDEAALFCGEVLDRVIESLQSMEYAELDILARTFDGHWKTIVDSLREMVMIEYESLAAEINDDYKRAVSEVESLKATRNRGRPKLPTQGKNLPIYANTAIGRFKGQSVGWVQVPSVVQASITRPINVV